VRGVPFIRRLTRRSGKELADGRKLTDGSSLTLSCGRASMPRTFQYPSCNLLAERRNERPRLKAGLRDNKMKATSRAGLEWQESPNCLLIGRDGRHEETRTPDLYLVKFMDRILISKGL
jgi:hypothetical protein